MNDNCCIDNKTYNCRGYVEVALHSFELFDDFNGSRSKRPKRPCVSSSPSSECVSSDFRNFVGTIVKETTSSRKKKAR